MDLKNRFLSLGLELPVVEKLLPVITPAEAAEFYESSDEELRKKIPGLLERVVNNSFKEDELDLDKIGLKTPGDDNRTNLPIDSHLPLPPATVTNEQSQRPGFAAQPEKKFSGCLFSIIGCAMLIGGIFILIRATQNRMEPEKKTAQSSKEKTLPAPNDKAPVLRSIELDLPKPPEFRGSWMFMPWDNYEPSIICRDGRFKEVEQKYTFQFWMKMTKKIPEKVTIMELIGEKRPAESIFLNEDGLICFNPGNGYPNLALRKRIPDNGQHFHIAATRDGNVCRLFVNGKLRQESVIEFKEKSPERDFLILMRSKSTLKGLAIDELMVSNEVLFEKNFKPERVLTMSKSTVLYMPFERADSASIQCYGNSHFQQYYPTGGKWLNVLNEVQQVINQIEFTEDVKGRQSSPSEP